MASDIRAFYKFIIKSYDVLWFIRIFFNCMYNAE